MLLSWTWTTMFRQEAEARNNSRDDESEDENLKCVLTYFYEAEISIWSTALETCTKREKGEISEFLQERIDSGLLAMGFSQTETVVCDVDIDLDPSRNLVAALDPITTTTQGSDDYYSFAAAMSQTNESWRDQQHRNLSWQPGQQLFIYRGKCQRNVSLLVVRF